MDSQSVPSGSSYFPVADGVWGMKDLFVNYYIIQNADSDSWYLVDAGLKWSAMRIKQLAAELFGEGAKPSAIILTHGHFDHVGALPTLVREWNVPVYCHKLEMPYLNGKSAYPPADPTVGGGLMSSMSWMYPTGPTDVHDHLHALPENNSIPGLEGWQYIHTPGHSPGHISLFRESDKVLISGDAFVTTKTESAFCALSYKKKLSGPPKFLTCNWASAKISVLKLAALDPETVAAGHGYPMRGEEMRTALHRLSQRFDQLAQPFEGRYINEPAVADESGVQYLPPATEKVPALAKVIGISLALLTVAAVVYTTRKPSTRTPLPKIAKTGLRTSKRFRTLERAFGR